MTVRAVGDNRRLTNAVFMSSLLKERIRRMKRIRSSRIRNRSTERRKKGRKRSVGRKADASGGWRMQKGEE